MAAGVEAVSGLLLDAAAPPQAAPTIARTAAIANHLLHLIKLLNIPSYILAAVAAVSFCSCF